MKSDAATDPLSQFFTLFEESITPEASTGAFMALVLSRPTVLPAEFAGARRADVKLVLIKERLHLSFLWNFERRDETRNLLLDAGTALLRTLIGSAFRNADLRLSTRDWSLRTDKKGGAHLVRGKNKAVAARSEPLCAECSTQSDSCCSRPVVSAHNRDKHYLIEPSLPWLRLLGVSDAAGKVLPRMQDKYKQINKFAEVLEGLGLATLARQDASNTNTATEDALRPRFRLLDMGSGKGYLTFAAHQLLARYGQPLSLGIEYRPDLVQRCNTVAQQAGFYPALSFEAGGIADVSAAKVLAADAQAPLAADAQAPLVVIALHACDTATDDALLRALREQASLIVVSPCCHKQVRSDFQPTDIARSMTRFGILKERLAEMLTDSIRSLVLEAAGYKVKVFEFIDSEHTGKNLMISASRIEGLGEATDSSENAVTKPVAETSSARRARCVASAEELCRTFGVSRQYLLEQYLREFSQT